MLKKNNWTDIDFYDRLNYVLNRCVNFERADKNYEKKKNITDSAAAVCIDSNRLCGKQYFGSKHTGKYCFFEGRLSAVSGTSSLFCSSGGGLVQG